MQPDMNQLVGSHDICFVTLDTLRYDVACQCLEAGLTPNLARLLPGGKWEERHSPGNFTYSAHHAFFAGFLPTPARPGIHPRLFAARFPGSESTAPGTYVFDAPELVTGLAQAGYHTICIGGTGFFNKLSPLGSVLPGYFHESHWAPELGVTSANSTERQAALAEERLLSLRPEKRALLFVNISALHQPNCIFTPGASRDTLQTHAQALRYVDRHLPRLFGALQARGPAFCIVCSDHGTAYGEDGFHGHRLCHRVVWTVPYAQFILSASGAST